MIDTIEKAWHEFATRHGMGMAAFSREAFFAGAEWQRLIDAENAIQSRPAFVAADCSLGYHGTCLLGGDFGCTCRCHSIVAPGTPTGDN